MSAPTMAPPQGPQLSPYGILGDLARAIGPSAGGAIGSWLGNEQLGRQIGGYAGQLAQRYSPYGAGPHPAQWPQPIPAEILSALTQLPPHILAQLVSHITQIQQAQQQIPPQQLAAAGQIAPYGFFGDLVGRIAPHVGDYLGGATGRQIGDVAAQLAQRYLPFSAGPHMAQIPQVPQIIQPPQVPALPPVGQGQIAPYGFFGDLAGRIAPHIGEYFAGATGRTIGDVAGQLASFLPFAAGPAAAQVPQFPVVPQIPVVPQLPVVPQVPVTQAPGPLAPYGVFGGALGNFLGGQAGNAVGGWLGHPGAGGAVGTALGTALGAMLPFGAGPPVPAPLFGQPPFAPQYALR